MRFRSTQNIFKDFGDIHESKWIDSPDVGLPPKYDWDYSRELQIEDIDIWEVLYEQGGGVGAYAAWSPYAEFYMLRLGWRKDLAGYGIETYYGPGAQEKVQKRMKELNMNFVTHKLWVEPEDMWLYLKN
jgi:hypothetical protein